MIPAKTFRNNNCIDILREKMENGDFFYTFRKIVEYRNAVGANDKRAFKPCDSCYCQGKSSFIFGHHS